MKRNLIVLAVMICIFKTGTSQNTPGTLDRSFGTNGYVITNLREAHAGNPINAFMVLPDGSFFTALTESAYCISKHKADGSPDSSFNSDGRLNLSHEYDSSDLRARSLLYQPRENKILLVSDQINYFSHINGAVRLITLRRILPNGRIDYTFGVNGKLAISQNLRDSSMSLHSTSVDAEERILVVLSRKSSTNPDNNEIFTYRFTKDGNPDPEYGENGSCQIGPHLNTHLNLLHTYRRNDTLQYYFEDNQNRYICKTNPAGKIITDFGDNGYFKIKGRSYSLNSYKCFPADSGRVILINTSSTTTIVSRLLPTGVPDSSFMPGRRSWYEHSGFLNSGTPSTIPLHEGGCMIVYNKGQSLSLLKLRADYRIDSSFGDTGLYELAPADPDTQKVNYVTFPSSFRTFEPGAFYALTYSDSTTWAGRYIYSRTGVQQDLTFGKKGYIEKMRSGMMDLAIGAARLADSRILVLGISPSPGYYPDSSLYLHCYLPNGQPDKSFGNSGRVLIKRNIDDDHPVVYSPLEFLQVTPDNKILVGWYSNDIIYIRKYLPDGTPDQSFAQAGIATITGQGKVYCLAKLVCQPDGKLIIAYLSDWKPNLTGYLIRITKDGTIDPTLNVGFSGTIDDIIYTQTNKIIFYSNINTNLFRIYCINSTGNLDSGFYGKGYIESLRSVDHVKGIKLGEISKGIYYVIFNENQDYDKESTKTYYDTFSELKDYQPPTFRKTIPRPAFNGIEPYQEVAYAYLQNDKKIVMGSFLFDPPFSEKIVFTRITQDGKTDSTFGNNGILFVDSLKTAPGMGFGLGYYFIPYSRFLKAGDNDLLFVTNIIDKHREDIAVIKIHLGDIDCIPGEAPQITQSGYKLLSSATTGNQWYLNGTIIPGASEPSYMPLSAGTYTVKQFLNDCHTNFSNAIQVVTTAINSPEMDKQINIAPNPVTNKLQIQHKGTSSKFEVTVYTITGVLASPTSSFSGNHQIDLSNLSSGTYVVRIRNIKTKEQIHRVIIKK